MSVLLSFRNVLLLVQMCHQRHRIDLSAHNLPRDVVCVKVVQILSRSPGNLSARVAVQVLTNSYGRHQELLVG